MILRREWQVAAAGFDEINTAVEALTERLVVFNANNIPPPPGAIVFNLENVPWQVDTSYWNGHEVWDFSARNVSRYQARHVPIGYHKSMERFSPAVSKDIDVVFCGAMNARRCKIVDKLKERKINVVVVNLFGSERDIILARSKLAINMLYYEDGVFPALRVAHCVANKIPVISERCPEGWDFIETCEYEQIVDVAERLVRGTEKNLDSMALSCLEKFQQMPLILPI